MYSLIKPFIPYIALVVILGGTYAIGHIQGKSSCEIRREKEQVIAIGKTELALTKVEKNYVAEKDQLQSLPDSAGGVGALTAHAIDLLQ